MCGCKKAQAAKPTTGATALIAPVSNDSPVSTTVILQYLGKDPSADMRVNTATNAHYRLGANNIFTIFAEDLAVFLGMNNENRTLFQRVT